MASRDLYHNQLEGAMIDPAVYKTTQTSSKLDLAGFYGAVVVVYAGAFTDGTFDIKLQESDDDVTYTDVGASDFQGTATQLSSSANHHNLVFALGYMGAKRYVKAVATVGGSPATGGTFGVVGIKGFPRHKYTR